MIGGNSRALSSKGKTHTRRDFSGGGPIRQPHCLAHGGGRLAAGGCRRRAVHTELPRGLRHGLQVLDRRVVLHDRAGIHDVAALGADAFDQASAVRLHILRRAESQERVGNAAAQAKLASQDAVGRGRIAAVQVEYDAARGKLSKASRCASHLPSAYSSVWFPWAQSASTMGFRVGQ